MGDRSYTGTHKEENEHQGKRRTSGSNREHAGGGPVVQVLVGLLHVPLVLSDSGLAVLALLDHAHINTATRAQIVEDTSLDGLAHKILGLFLLNDR